MIIVNTILHVIHQFTLSCSSFNPQVGISRIFRRVNTYWVLCLRGIVMVSFVSCRLTICTSYCLNIIISYLNKNALLFHILHLFGDLVANRLLFCSYQIFMKYDRARLMWGKYIYVLFLIYFQLQLLLLSFFFLISWYDQKERFLKLLF